MWKNDIFQVVVIASMRTLPGVMSQNEKNSQGNIYWEIVK